MNWKNRFSYLPALLALACSPASAPPSTPNQEDAVADSDATGPGTTTHAAHDHGAGHGHGAMHGETHREMHEDMATMCPMKVPGTTVTSSDLAGAVALEFATTSDVAELRRRVAQMAEHHQTRHGGSAEAGGPGEKPHGEGAHSHHMMVPAQVRAEETPSGARLVFTPEQATDLDALREHLEKHSQHMAQGQCRMMSADGPATAPKGAPTATPSATAN